MRAHGTPLTTLADARVTLLDLALGVPGPDRRWHGPAGPAGTPAPDPADRRPLLGEPLALDLLNTRWDAPGGARDLLDDLDGYRIWLSSAGLTGLCPDAAAALSATRHTREVLQATLNPPYDQRRPGEAPADPDAVHELDRLLGHGTLRYRLTADGPATTVEVGDPAWLAGWLALDDYLRLLGTAPERIRSCAGPHRVPLWFLDTSRNGMRRWCSMAECGNRAKAARHYRRLRSEQPAVRGTARVAVG
ncbi:CGNR zinc finger domain-containing protein [Kitasatospora sp. NPDC085879]|uniref:CGNR zinc finger domain-containing protein n=1 Tax=Kitasatospora sp. NPDC085879 TaxID=3154769 RepID=UPI00341D2F01